MMQEQSIAAEQSVARKGSDDSKLVQRTLTLTSLAMLKVDIDERHRSYIDYLITFVLSVLKTHKPDVITDSLVADLLEKDFGLKVPVKATQHALRRMARVGYLRKEHGMFYPELKLPQVDISVKRHDAANQIQRVYNALCKFAPTVHKDLTWTDSDAALAIIGFLGRFAVDCLKAYVFNTALPQVPETSPKELYIVSRFVQEAHEHDPSLFEDFIVLVKGQMYANALICPDLQSLAQKFDRVTFYLDTPLILNLLDLQGHGRKQAAEELISLLRDLKGEIAVFEHTLEETKGAIRYAVGHFNDPQVATRILRELRTSGIAFSDLVLCLDQLRERLSAYHVRIRPTPKYEKSLQIDEKSFQAALEHEVRYPTEHALINDINSVRSIYVLRRHVDPARLEDSVAIVVTTNPAFAKVAFRYANEHEHKSSKEVSSVITDYSLANVAWLKAPMKRPGLPEKETLAMCYAALEPTRELFKKYVETMDRLKQRGNISEEDHAILRASPFAHRELMDFTLGDEEALTGTGVRQILDRVKESLIQEHRELAAEERARREEQYEQAMLGQLEKEKALRAELDKQHDERLVSKEEKDRLEREQSELLLSASRRARHLTKVLTVTGMAVFSAVLLLGAVVGSGLLKTQSLNSFIVKVLLIACVLIAVLWGWYSWMSGKSVRGVTEQIEHRITLRIFAWLTGRRALPEA